VKCLKGWCHCASAAEYEVTFKTPARNPNSAWAKRFCPDGFSRVKKKFCKAHAMPHLKALQEREQSTTPVTAGGKHES